MPFETEVVRVERKNVFLLPKISTRKIILVVRKVTLKEANDYQHDLDYWMDKPPAERLAAVTFLIRQSLKKGQRMDKSHLIKRKLKP